MWKFWKKKTNIRKPIKENMITGVIYAGSNRFSINDRFMPKSLLEVDAKSLFEYTLENMLKLNLSEIYVFCDDCMDEYKKILEKYPNVKLLFCDDYNSTLNVVQNYIGLFNEYILFNYGSMPKKPRQLKALYNQEEDLVATSYLGAKESQAINDALDAFSVPLEDSVKKSQGIILEITKESKIVINGNVVNPPYLIKKEIAMDSPAMTWQTFFTMNKEKLVFVKDDVGDFNNLEEFEEFQKYIYKHFK
ncbi:MAG: hypothetical protein FWG51_01615 [Firmicutes bacterium]|nr:hypothetical protein [Bacillota bacterium]